MYPVTLNFNIVPIHLNIKLNFALQFAVSIGTDLGSGYHVLHPQSVCFLDHRNWDESHVLSLRKLSFQVRRVRNLLCIQALHSCCTNHKVSEKLGGKVSREYQCLYPLLGRKATWVTLQGDTSIYQVLRQLCMIFQTFLLVPNLIQLSGTVLLTSHKFKVTRKFLSLTENQKERSSCGNQNHCSARILCRFCMVVGGVLSVFPFWFSNSLLQSRLLLPQVTI